VPTFLLLTSTRQPTASRGFHSQRHKLGNVAACDTTCPLTSVESRHSPRCTLLETAACGAPSPQFAGTAELGMASTRGVQGCLGELSGRRSNSSKAIYAKKLASNTSPTHSFARRCGRRGREVLHKSIAVHSFPGGKPSKLPSPPSGLGGIRGESEQGLGRGRKGLGTRVEGVLEGRGTGRAHVTAKMFLPASFLPSVTCLRWALCRQVPEQKRASPRRPLNFVPHEAQTVGGRIALRRWRHARRFALSR
jgi:hypothetical protein